MSAVEVEAEMIEAMRKAGTPPQIVYAYKRTRGLLLTEDMREHWPPDRVKEWDDATDFSHLPERKNMKTEHVSLGHKGSFNVKKGALHKMLGIPEGEKIPASKLQPHAGDSPLLRRRKASAKGFRSMAH